jgi:hypothetical protein
LKPKPLPAAAWFVQDLPAAEEKFSPTYAVKNSGETSSLLKELAGWFHPINFYVYLWQPLRLRNYFYAQHPFFKAALRLPHFKACWHNITKGSFAYNTFLFRKPAFSANYNNTFLADLTCLALLFGDEFIDGICSETGKPALLKLLKENDSRFYLMVRTNKDGCPELGYDFNLYQLLPAYVWEIRNKKYGITYAEFYRLLKQLLELMNSRLKRMKRPIAEAAALKIKEACDLCFDTFVHDVKDIPVQLSLDNASSPVYWHDKKNRSIQVKLLELRCLLLYKKADRYSPDYLGWLDIISTMQVYDDMQDCRGDENFQDNLLLAIACSYFPEEIEWFHRHKTKPIDEEQWRFQLSLHMPGSVYLCTRMCKEKIMSSMNWTQKKICNYLWINNWFRAEKKPGKKKYSAAELHNLFAGIMEKTKPVLQLTGDEEEWKSYAVEICFHHRQLRRFISSVAGRKENYFLYFNFLQMSSSEKARLADKICGMPVT